MSSWAIYIHIPFCIRRCPYCDFNTYAGLERLQKPYVEALEREIRAYGQRLGRPQVPTVFFGGGTPTTLTGEQLCTILGAVREAFDVLPNAEITSEANPGTVDSNRFSAMRDAGFNRLSLGVQSFNDDELHFLGRIHSAEEATEAYYEAHLAGFRNVNLDLMFGLPLQEAATWKRSLRRAIELKPEHLSLYALTVEQGTPLARWVADGRVPPPDDDAAAEMYDLACDVLEKAGYRHYEISNWALAGERDWRCRHNLVYWRYEPYLGFGAGAHSFDGKRRWWNVSPVAGYIDRLSRGETPVESWEDLDERLAMGEMMMVGLRLLEEGVPDARFRARFGISLQDAFSEEIGEMTQMGLVEWHDAGLRLTRRGWLVANRVFARFLP